jgi:rubredoxin
MQMKQPELVTATQAELDDILAVTKAVLPEKQYQLLEGVFRTFAFMMLRLQDARASVGRLRRLLFGARTERLRNVIEDAKVVPDGKPADDAVAVDVPDSASTAQDAVSGAPSERKKAKGHGRNGVKALRGATIVECCHEQLHGGQRCPECGVGRIYDCPPSTVVRFSGQAPLAATVYRRQRLRCRLCDTVYAAALPEGVSQAPKYDASCASMLALLRYGSGMPFYRLQGLQASLHMPLSDATQWDIVEQAVSVPRQIYQELIRQAAQAPLLHNDDTPARVLALMKQRQQAEAAGQPTPKAINTSGIVALLDAQHQVVLFFTGHAHAGQNLEKVLAQRAQELAAPMHMCDALAANMAGDFITVLCHCLAHGRRKVIEVLEHFPEQGRHILQVLAQVYAADEQCRQQQLSAPQRLAYHQMHSGPLMQDLKTWMNQRFEQREVEPNSGLGQAMNYLLKHWEPLTLFLRRAGAPLDNSICERALKRAILHRKNSLFFKTLEGAHIGDIYMSLIYTCVACKANAFEYLQALQLNAQRVSANVAQWLPWNYREQLSSPVHAVA